MEDNATAAAYIIWQIALHFTRHLHEEKFEYRSDEQRFGVLAEYLIFLSHATDRIAHSRLPPETRPQYINVLCNQVARHYQRNAEEILGGGDYRPDFLARMNRGFEQYSAGEFDGDRPGYAARRLLGNRIQETMGMSQSNRWVIQQVIDIDAPDAVDELLRGLGSLVENPGQGTSGAGGTGATG